MGKTEKTTFEESFDKLEKCASKLRNGDTSLEEAVELYNRSLVYYKQCQEILDNAKQSIKILDPDSKKVVDFNEQ